MLWKRIESNTESEHEHAKILARGTRARFARNELLSTIALARI